MKSAKAVSRRIFFLITAFLLLNSPAYAKVLIIQDSLPWESTAIQDTLTINSIDYDEKTSSQLVTLDLFPYEMIIVPSDQTAAYYTNWNASILKIEEYIKNGGKLWQSACNNTSPEPLIPGGLVSSNDYDGTNIIVITDHPWVEGVPNTMYGNSASHNSFTNLYPGSKIIATDSTGSPVLVDYRYFAGRVFLTGQTLEWAWINNIDGKPIIENSLLDLYNADLTKDVLVIQDTVPFSSLIGGPTVNPIHYVFTDNSVNYYQITSAQISGIELSPFAMIVVPSVQGSTYYSNWNSNIGKIEEYVQNGGKLWQSTSNKLSTTIEPDIPGGVTSSSDFDFFNTISMPGHPWVQGVPNPMYGNAANHDSFTNLYTGSKIIAKTQMSKRPVLVDFRYYAGRVLITGQPLEYAWHFEQDGKPIFENSLLDLINSPISNVLIIQDKLPWLSTAIQDALDINSINYDQITSTLIKTTDLSKYKMLVVPSDQNDTYYSNWNANLTKIETYVSSGGKLWQSACNSTTTEPLIPGGVVSSNDIDYYNDIILTNHPWVKGVPNPMYGTSASHNSFISIYPGSRVIAKAQSSGKPVLVDYRYGAGRILITGQTLEHAVKWNKDGKPILENSLLDLYSESFPWTLFLPAILMNHAKH